jgi:hypothetical protein
LQRVAPRSRNWWNFWDIFFTCHSPEHFFEPLF